MSAIHPDFAAHACELFSSIGPCQAKRMFGGWGISVDGLTVAIIADLGQGACMWLKADEANRQVFEAAGCARFTYTSQRDGKAVTRGINYFSAPEEALDSAQAMAPWARLALAAAIQARGVAKPKKPAARRASTPRS